MVSQAETELHQNLNQITELEKNLKRISENVLSITKNSIKDKTDMKLKMAQLRKKKLEVLALVARSQAVLATMEVLIAENELEELKPAKEVKRKSDTKSDSNAKKSKVEGCKETIDQPKKPRKQTKKSTEKSPKDKKTSGLSATPPKLAASAPATPTCKKTMDKENSYVPAPSYGKQLIVLSRPPIRSNLTSNQTGYLTDNQSLHHRQNKIENSIYNHAANVEEFAKTMSLSTNESYLKRYLALYNPQAFNNQNVINKTTNLTQSVTGYQINNGSVGNHDVTNCDVTNLKQNMSVCNQNIGSVGNQDNNNNNQNVTTCQMTNFTQKFTVCNKKIANNRDPRKGFYQNQTALDSQNNFICQRNSLPDSAYHTDVANKSVVSQNMENSNTDSSENVYGNFFETTNQIFKDIMDKKGLPAINQIKIEKEIIPDNSSENTLVIDVPAEHFATNLPNIEA